MRKLKVMIACVVFVGATTATTATAATKFAVYAEGRDVDRARAKIVEVISREGEVVDLRAFAAALALPAKGPELLDTNANQPLTPALRDKVCIAGGKVGAAVVVLARVLPGEASPRKMRIVVVNVGSIDEITNDTVVIARAEKRNRKNEWKDEFGELEAVLHHSTASKPTSAPVVGAGGSRTSAAAPAGSSATSTRSSDISLAPAAGASRTAAGPRGGEHGSVVVAYKHGSRQLALKMPAGASLRPYSPSLGAPGMDLELRLYPLAILGKNDVLADIGVEGGYERAFLMKSKLDGGGNIDTSWSAWWLGARMRWLLSGHELGARLGYSQLRFMFAPPSGSTVDGLPGVGYGSLRLGGDAALRVASGRALASVSFLLPVHVGGNVGQAFPHSGAWGIDASLGARMAIPALAGLEGQVMARFAQFNLSGDGSSATDRFFDLLLGVAYSF